MAVPKRPTRDVAYSRTGYVPIRSNVEDWHDPYNPDGHFPDGSHCGSCGAVVYNQHWVMDDDIRQQLEDEDRLTDVTCPGCRKVDVRDPGGIVTVKGSFWQEHKEEVLNLIHNEEQRALGRNPLEKIINMVEKDGELTITTTNEKLAQQFGRTLNKAFNGEVDYKFGDGNKFARVTWQRD